MDNRMKAQPMLTPNEVAERLKLAPKTVRALIHGRHLKACNVTADPKGRPTYRIDPAEVDRFKEQQQVEKPAESKRRQRLRSYDEVISFV